MITPSFSPTATERVLPRMALDFTTGVLDSRVTITRALNTATRVNSSGLIELVNANLPRFDYDPVTLAPKGLLIEEARTNLITYSEQLNNAAWIPSNITVTANATTSPDGTANAELLTPSSTSAFIYQTIIMAVGSYTYSVWLRSGTGSNVSLNISANGSGVTPNPTSTAITVTPQWQRFTLPLSGLVATANIIIGSLTAGTWPSGATIYAWGAQVEAGAFATSYIPTTTTSLTRNADNVQMTGTNFSDWYNASEGAFYASWIEGGDSALYGVLSADDGTADNYVDIRRQNSTSVRSLVRSGASAIATLSITNNYAGNQQLAFVSAYKVDSYAASVNQSTVTTDSSGAVPLSPNQLQLGTLAGVTPYQLNGWLQQVKYWPQRLINAEVQAFAK